MLYRTISTLKLSQRAQSITSWLSDGESPWRHGYVEGSARGRFARDDRIIVGSGRKSVSRLDPSVGIERHGGVAHCAIQGCASTLGGAGTPLAAGRGAVAPNRAELQFG